jgi:hypothetical protein
VSVTITLVVVGRRSCWFWRKCCALIFNAVALVSSFNALVVDINGQNYIFSDKAVVRRVRVSISWCGLGNCEVIS